MIKPIQSCPKQQKGSVLVIGLVILLVISFIGISSISSSKLELKMSNNDRHRQLGFQAAEAALREGERVANTTDARGLANDACTGGYCSSRGYYINRNQQAVNKATSANYCSTDFTPERWVTGCGGTSLEVWSTANLSMAYSGSAIPGVAVTARYIIEYLDDVDCSGSPIGPPYDCQLFRVTALGYGGTENSPVMLQSVFTKG
ncbi:MAG: hypothetical protein JKX83_04730 [Pseudomonadales bacterium]|nr:hypothetical protein [Pseudomonadales bacterium]